VLPIPVKTALAPLVVVAACAALGAAPVDAAAPSATLSNTTLDVTAGSVSSNWAGYVATGPDAASATSFTSVSSRWVQPRARCSSGLPSYSAFWVGLGGASSTSTALEQIGTAGDCNARGKVSYYMWYELVPAPSVPIKYKVFPGNVVEATVNVVGTRVTLQIRNLTRRTRFTKVLRTSSPELSSAEWIAEAPSSCDSSGRCVVLPLADFGTVSFTHASSTADAHTGTIGDAAWSASPIELVSDAQAVDPAGNPFAIGAVPSALSSDGAEFSVDWAARAITGS
jgi:hypothetical protein